MKKYSKFLSIKPKNKNFKATFTYNFENEYFMDFTLGLSDCR